MADLATVRTLALRPSSAPSSSRFRRSLSGCGGRIQSASLHLLCVFVRLSGFGFLTGVPALLVALEALKLFFDSGMDVSVRDFIIIGTWWTDFFCSRASSSGLPVGLISSTLSCQSWLASSFFLKALLWLTISEYPPQPFFVSNTP